jgi:hypothetical protein
MSTNEKYRKGAVSQISISIFIDAVRFQQELANFLFFLSGSSGQVMHLIEKVNCA